MPMHNPPHPGEFISAVYLEPFAVSARRLALRLSKTLGRSAESWLAMQDAHDLWQARKHLNLDHVSPLELEIA